MKKILIISLSLISTQIYAQQSNGIKAGNAFRAPFEVKYLGEGIPTSDDVELVPQLTHLVSKNESDNEKELEILKEEKMKEKELFLSQHPELSTQQQDVSNKKSRTLDPVFIVGYNALGNNGTPSDNTAAVNTNNQLVCSVNSSLRVYNTTTGAGLASTTSLASFFATPSNGSLLTNSLCDPKVIFDQQAQRFIIFAQTCDGSSNTSQILLAFSKTSDPTPTSGTGWYFYTFTGNPSSSIGQNTWFDYPKIGVSNSDVFVTGNLFDNGGNYVESVIYQINKTKCYAGNTINSGDALLWYNIDNNPFTMVPMSNGQTGGYGNNMYLASTKNTAFGPNIALFEITNSTANNPQLTSALIATDTTSSPADAIQSGTSVDLDLGDSRGMDGFYLNGTIHYVFHCDVGAGYSGINYSRITKSGNSWTLKRRIIKMAGKDLGFPAITSFGYTANDQSAIIGFNYASSSEFPGMKAIYVDHDMTPSNPIEIKTGTGYASVFPSGGVTRWGDYSGMTRVQNATKPTAWHFGMFGNTSHTWTNYFAKISTQGWPLNTSDIQAENQDLTVYPNPVTEDIFNATITLQAAGIIDVKLLDINGRFVRNIYSGPATKGKILFSFNKGALPSGTYLLNFSLDHQLLQNEKITVIHP